MKGEYIYTTDYEREKGEIAFSLQITLSQKREENHPLISIWFMLCVSDGNLFLKSQRELLFQRYLSDFFVFQWKGNSFSISLWGMFCFLLLSIHFFSHTQSEREERKLLQLSKQCIQWTWSPVQMFQHFASSIDYSFGKRSLTFSLVTPLRIWNHFSLLPKSKWKRRRRKEKFMTLCVVRKLLLPSFTSFFHMPQWNDDDDDVIYDFLPESEIIYDPRSITLLISVLCCGCTFSSRVVESRASGPSGNMSHMCTHTHKHFQIYRWTREEERDLRMKEGTRRRRV